MFCLRVERLSRDTLPDYPRSCAARRRRTFSGRTPSARGLERWSTTEASATSSARWASLVASSCRSTSRWRSYRLRVDCQTRGASPSPARGQNFHSGFSRGKFYGNSITKRSRRLFLRRTFDNEHDGNLLFTSVYQLFHYEVIWINSRRNFCFADVWVSEEIFTSWVAKYFH